MGVRQKNALIVIALFAAIVAVMSAKHMRFQADAETLGGDEVVGSGVPVLLELGSHTCNPCKLMMPILRELKDEYAGKMEIGYVDIFKDKAIGEKYGIRVMPTQIFFDSEGKELFRHEGFFAKENILAKWKELGVSFGETL